ncbi:MAG TPA: signal peptidase II [Actinopolymorphaceae bacterium]
MQEGRRAPVDGPEPGDGATPVDAEAGSADGHDHSVGSASSVKKRSILLLAVVALCVLAADVTSKILAVAHLSDTGPVPLVDGLLTLRLVRNPGAAFGLAGGYTVVLSIIALSVALVVLRLSRSLQSKSWAVAFGLLLGGALGNLSDRIFRAPGFLQGHVVDFLELPHWPVFNLADSSICASAALIMVLAVRGRRWDGAVEGRRSEPASDETTK